MFEELIPALVTANRMACLRANDREPGPVADRIIANCTQRLLVHLSTADADAAELEMEGLVWCLHLMWRLARGSRANSDRKESACVRS